jgi:hypothetical protein
VFVATASGRKTGNRLGALSIHDLHFPRRPTTRDGRVFFCLWGSGDLWTNRGMDWGLAGFLESGGSLIVLLLLDCTVWGAFIDGRLLGMKGAAGLT